MIGESCNGHATMDANPRFKSVHLVSMRQNEAGKIRWLYPELVRMMTMLFGLVASHCASLTYVTVCILAAPVRIGEQHAAHAASIFGCARGDI